MSDRTPADVIADVEGNGDDMYYTLPVGPKVADEILAALAAAGYRVVPIPDDNSRALAARLRDLLDAANKADRPHRYPHHVADGEVLVWKCARCDEWIRESGKRTSCAAAPPPAKLYVPSALIDAAAALLDGQPQDRPDRCPEHGCEGGVKRVGVAPNGAPAYVDCSYCGGSGDTR